MLHLFLTEPSVLLRHPKPAAKALRAWRAGLTARDIKFFKEPPKGVDLPEDLSLRRAFEGVDPNLRAEEGVLLGTFAWLAALVIDTPGANLGTVLREARINPTRFQKMSRFRSMEDAVRHWGPILRGREVDLVALAIALVDYPTEEAKWIRFDWAEAFNREDVPVD